MHSRKPKDATGRYLPKSWSENVVNLLNSIYESQCQARNQKIEAYGKVYEDEVLVGISLLSTVNEAEIPVTYIMSAELTKERDAEKTFDTLIDSIGIFFENYFANPEWNDYEAAWKEAEFNGLKFHYQVTRENIGLTIMADQLLDQ